MIILTTLVSLVSSLLLSGVPVEAVDAATTQTTPYFTATINCISINEDKKNYTAYFGYRNDGPGVDLEVSKITPAQLPQNAVTRFESGKHDRAFSIESTSKEQNIVWTIKAYGKGKTATASLNSKKCPQTTTPNPNPITEEPKEEKICINSSCTMFFPEDPVPSAVEDKLKNNPADQVVGLSIVLKDQADLSSCTSIIDKDQNGWCVKNKLVEKTKVTGEKTEAQLELWKQENPSLIVTPFYIFNGYVIQTTAPKALEYTQVLKTIDEVGIVEFLVKPKVANFEFGANMIDATSIAEAGNTGQNVTVGIIDSGVRYTHQDLVASYRGNTGAGFSHDYNWFDTLGISNVPVDCDGHGTHVTGIVAGTATPASSNPTGIASGVKWIASRIEFANDSTSCPIASFDSQLKAMEFMLAPHPQAGNAAETGDPTKRPDVVNNSYGNEDGPYFSDFIAVDSWRAANILPVYAIGNDGPTPGRVGYPGAMENAFAVGSVNKNKIIANSSSRGPVAFDPNLIKPDVVAPGVGIKSTYSESDNDYAKLEGTSMAAPHVAGCAALMISANPSLSVAQIETQLKSTTEDLGIVGPDQTYGHGLIKCPVANKKILLGGFTFKDNNGNGLFDPDNSSDFFKGGVTVSLLDDEENIIGSKLTNDDGSYYFEVESGKSYKVQFNDPSGEVLVFKNSLLNGNSAPLIDSDPDEETTITDLITVSDSSNLNIWAGYETAISSSIGDQVWHDKNGNGLQDDGEEGVNGVKVDLFDSNNQLIQTTTTSTLDGVSGSYLFNNLPFGRYKVSFSNLPTNSSFTVVNASNPDKNSDVTLPNGFTDLIELKNDNQIRTIDAGIVINQITYETGRVSGRVWIDTNNNNLYDENIDLVPSYIDVDLYDKSGTYIQTASSDFEGIYRLFNVPTNTEYYIQTPDKYNYNSPTLSSYEFVTKNINGSDPQFAPFDSDVNANGKSDIFILPNTGTSSPQIINLDAGYKNFSYIIQGTIWFDRNGDGSSLGELDIENYTTGVKLELFEWDEQTQQLIPTGKTQLSVQEEVGYIFKELDPNKKYKVKVDVPSGYELTFKDNINPEGENLDNFDSDFNQTTFLTDPVSPYFTRDFGHVWTDAGFVPIKRISGVIWDDINQNGIREVGEEGLPNVTLELLDQNGNVLATTQTSNAFAVNGYYTFAIKQNGNYKVRVKPLNDYLISPQNQGNNELIDSDYEATGGVSSEVRVDDQTGEIVLDGGLYKPTLSRISGRLFIDNNYNGIRDAEDLFQAGDFKFALYKFNSLSDQDGFLISVTTLNSAGEYEFNNLTPGRYKVRVSNNPQFAISPINVGTDASKDSDFEFNSELTQMLIVGSGQQISNIDVGVLEKSIDLHTNITVDNANPKVGDTISYTFELNNTNTPKITEPDFGPRNLKLILNPDFFDNQELESIESSIAGCCQLDETDSSKPNLVITPTLQNGAILTIKVKVKIKPGSEGKQITTKIDSLEFETNFDEINPNDNLGNSVVVSVQEAPIVYGIISGNVFEDSNANQSKDANESGIQGIKVELVDENNQVTARAISNTDGSWTLQPTAIGNYRIRYLTIPEGYRTSVHTQNSQVQSPNTTGEYQLESWDSLQPLSLSFGLTYVSPCSDPNATYDGNYCVLPPSVTSKDCPQGYALTLTGLCSTLVDRCPIGYVAVGSQLCSYVASANICPPNYIKSTSGSCTQIVPPVCSPDNISLAAGQCGQITPKACNPGYVLENGVCRYYSFKYYTPTFKYALCDEINGNNFYVTDLKGIENNPSILDCTYGSNRYRTIERTGTVTLDTNGVLCVTPQNPRDFGIINTSKCEANNPSWLVASFCRDSNDNWSNQFDLNVGAGLVPRCPQGTQRDDSTINVISPREGAQLVSNFYFPGAVTLKYLLDTQNACPEGFTTLDDNQCVRSTSPICSLPSVTDGLGNCVIQVPSSCPPGLFQSGNNCLQIENVTCPGNSSPYSNNQCISISPSTCPNGFVSSNTNQRECTKENKILALTKLLTPENISSDCSADQFQDNFTSPSPLFRCELQLSGRVDPAVKYILPAGYKFGSISDFEDGNCNVQNDRLFCEIVLEGDLNPRNEQFPVTITFQPQSKKDVGSVLINW